MINIKKLVMTESQIERMVTTLYQLLGEQYGFEIKLVNKKKGVNNEKETE